MALKPKSPSWKFKGANMAKLVFHQKLTEDCVLTVYGDKNVKLADIGLGTDVDAARKTADALIKVLREVS